MKIKFVGPKPIISHTGIVFDTNKEDKYNYINITLQLIKALDHEYIPEKKYTYQTDMHRLTDKEMFQALEQHCNNLKEIITNAHSQSTAYVDNMLYHAKNNTTLSDVERETLMKNIEIMRTYMTQRYVNKNAYYCAIDVLANIMKRGHIDYVIAPMYERFVHIFHSVEGVLHKGRTPTDTNIEIYEEKGDLFVKLDLLQR